MGQHLITIVTLFVTTVVSCNGCIYEKFNPDHTGCKSRNPQCDIVDTEVTDNEKNLVVRLHNEYREKVAMGRELAAGGLPTASNMLEMVWDDELEYIAQRHAETCEFEHDCGDCRIVDRFYVGQNLYLGLSSDLPSGNDQWIEMMHLYYTEVQKFNKQYVSDFNFNLEYGHFSQVIWADTWKVGCGKAVFKKDEWYQTLIVCNYGEGGNAANSEVYKVGSPCSECPSDTCCGDSCNQSDILTNYEGLCKKLDTS